MPRRGAAARSAARSACRFPILRNTMTRQTRGEFVLFCTTFIWGGTFAFTKVALADVTPSLFVGIRYTIATIAVILLAPRSLRLMRGAALRKGIVLGLLIGGGMVLQTYGLGLTTASKSAFITGMMVVFTPLAQLFIERRAPRYGNIAGIVIVSAGLYFLTSPSGAGFNLGDGLTLAAALLYGIYIVYLDVYSKTEELYPLVLGQIVVTGLIAWLVVPFEHPHIVWSGLVISALLYMAILATVVTSFLQTKYQKETTPTRAAIIFTLEPLWSAIIAYFVLGEILGMLGALGGILIIGGILVSELADGIIDRVRGRLGLPGDAGG